MNLNFLDFEQPIAELEAKIEELRLVGVDSEINISEEITRLEHKNRQLTESIFSNLSDWRVVQLARHPQRPYIQDYISRICTDFDELEGDRHCSNGPAIIGGIARLEGKPIMIMGHQKGRKTKEKLYRNFGSARPEEYRKTLRLLEIAERFKLPVISLIDTAGAYPGIGAEERNQSEAIARNLQVLSSLKTPVICTVVGEGGSGGALAIGVGDRIMMLQYSIYSVISPEGCATILWKSAEKASTAADAMGVTAQHVKKMGLIDEIIKEPLGGAHRDFDAMAKALKNALVRNLAEVQNIPIVQLLEQRYERIMSYGLQR